MGTEFSLAPTAALSTRAVPSAQTKNTPEAKLIAAAKAGDQDAFAELRKRSRRRVRVVWLRFFNRLAFDQLSTDAEDFEQDVYLCAWRGLQGFEGKSNFTTWVSQIAEYESLRIAENRKRPTKGSSCLDPYFVEVAGGDEGNEDEHPQAAKKNADIRKVEGWADLSKLFPLLPPKSREFAKLVAKYGDSIHDIAEAQGAPLKTAESRLTRLLGHIEKIVSPK